MIRFCFKKKAVKQISLAQNALQKVKQPLEMVKWLNILHLKFNYVQVGFKKIHPTDLF